MRWILRFIQRNRGLFIFYLFFKYNTEKHVIIAMIGRKLLVGPRWLNFPPHQDSHSKIHTKGNYFC